jgi:hypothetical protein
VPNLPLNQTRLLAISDAAPSRNGAGAYYLDLLEQMEGRLKKLLFIPRPSMNRVNGMLVLHCLCLAIKHKNCASQTQEN